MNVEEAEKWETRLGLEGSAATLGQPQVSRRESWFWEAREAKRGEVSRVDWGDSPEEAGHSFRCSAFSADL